MDKLLCLSVFSFVVNRVDPTVSLSIFFVSETDVHMYIETDYFRKKWLIATWLFLGIIICFMTKYDRDQFLLSISFRNEAQSIFYTQGVWAYIARWGSLIFRFFFKFESLSSGKFLACFITFNLLRIIRPLLIKGQVMTNQDEIASSNIETQ